MKTRKMAERRVKLEPYISEITYETLVNGRGQPKVTLAKIQGYNHESMPIVSMGYALKASRDRHNPYVGQLIALGRALKNFEGQIRFIKRPPKELVKPSWLNKDEDATAPKSDFGKGIPTLKGIKEGSD